MHSTQLVCWVDFELGLLMALDSFKGEHFLELDISFFC